MTQMMNAVQINSFGGPEVLIYGQAPIPQVGPRDILLKVAACGIDRKDLSIREGTIRKKSVAYRTASNDKSNDIEFPLILGTEISGTIVETGSQIHQFTTGQRVASLPRRGHCGTCLYCHTGRSESCASAWFIGQDANGGYAQYVLVGADSIYQVPDAVDLQEACMSAACIGTMIRAIRDIGKVQIGEKVLITGASGGLGVHAIQLAKLAGAFVIATTSSSKKVNQLKMLGADEVIVTEKNRDWSSEVTRMTSGQGVDVGIDIVGVSNFKSTLKSMALYGRLVCVGEVEGGVAEFRPAIALLKRLQILGSYAPGVEHMAKALELMADKKIKAIVDSYNPLQDAAKSHEKMMQSTDNFGRLILVPGN
ncbi:MAG: zinc-binding dehydrogenase [Betaproteobacteria bacterium]